MKRKKFVRVCAKLLSGAIYCANPRTKKNPQSGSQYCRRLGSQYPRIIRGYDIATLIVILPLSQPRPCKIGSPIFAFTSQLKLTSTTRASFISMPSTDITNREKCFRRLWKLLPFLSFFVFPPRQERSHWLLLVGVTVWVPQSDINYGFCLTLT